MLISLGRVPMVPLGMQKMLTCLTCPLCQSRYCSSENSWAPPPVPRITPISRFCSMDMAAGSSPASLIASVDAATASGTTRETCLRSRASTQASSSNSGISPAICTGRDEGSKREMRFTPDFPARRARQKASLPMPLGLTTPSPVMTTRGAISNLRVILSGDSGFASRMTSHMFSPDHVTRSGIISHVPLGLYISVPFCRTKCSYCNFASDVFSRAVFERYVERVVEDIHHADELAGHLGGVYESAVDSIFLGGGTPTILDISQLERLFVTISQTFAVERDAEITVECAPGTLTPAVLEAFQRCGVNRVSLGVQSFVDPEAASVGRQHKHATVLDDIARLRASGIENINIDLIAGLPHQTAESWEFSVAEAIDRCGSRQCVHAGGGRRFPPGSRADGRRHKISCALRSQR